MIESRKHSVISEILVEWCRVNDLIDSFKNIFLYGTGHTFDSSDHIMLLRMNIHSSFDSLYEPVLSYLMMDLNQ